MYLLVAALVVATLAVLYLSISAGKGSSGNSQQANTGLDQTRRQYVLSSFESHLSRAGDPLATTQQVLDLTTELQDATKSKRPSMLIDYIRKNKKLYSEMASKKETAAQDIRTYPTPMGLSVADTEALETLRDKFAQAADEEAAGYLQLASVNEQNVIDRLQDFFNKIHSADDLRRSATDTVNKVAKE
jgi:flagellar basal body-associated protein FliL